MKTLIAQREIIGFGIDFGGSQIKAAVIYNDGGIEHIRGQAPGDAIHSAYYKDPKNGKESYDANAIEQGYANPDYLALRFKRYLGSTEARFVGKTMTAEQVLTRVLVYVKQLAEKQTGRSLDHVPATLTAPANYDDLKKRSLMAAATAAGFLLLKDDMDGGCLISEPVAAIVRYSAQHGLINSGAKVQVNDFGSETFDTTAAEMTGNAIRALATDGVTRLGGGYIADALENLAFAQAAKELKVKAIDLKAVDSDEKFVFRQKIERLAISLGQRNGGSIAVPVGGGRMYTVTVTQPCYEAVVQPFVDQIVQCIVNTQAKAGLKAGDIQYHVLVGGPFAAIYLQECVAKAVGATPRTDINPITAVVEGALLNLHAIRSRRGEIEILVTPVPPVSDVSPHNYGVILLRFSDQKLISSILFPEGISVPAKKSLATRLCYSHQTQARIVLVQCSKDQEPMEECVVLGEVLLEDLPLETTMSNRIFYEAVFNQAGVIDVVVTDLVSGKKVKLTACVSLARPKT